MGEKCIEINGKFGKCIISDCLDPDVGLTRLGEREYSLVLTDPPYNVNYKKPCGLGERPKIKSTDRVLYEDCMTPEEYSGWCKIWGTEALRVAHNMVITPGNMNLGIWYSQFEIYDHIIWHKPNAQVGGKAAQFLRHETLLIFRPGLPKFQDSVIRFPLKNGFLRKNQPRYIHPTPKEYGFWELLVKKLTPSSVLDPFIGSGTTGEVCESLGIPWLGFEKQKEYAEEIQNRVNRGISRHSQQYLTQYIVKTEV